MILLASLGVLLFFIVWEIVFLLMQRSDEPCCWFENKILSGMIIITILLIFVGLPYGIYQECGLNWTIFVVGIEIAIALFFLMNYLIFGRKK